MSSEQIADLEREWKHASEIAFASIGQPDRAENVARRDELAAKLRTARVHFNAACPIAPVDEDRID